MAAVFIPPFFWDVDWSTINMNELCILYICLLVPSLIYFLVQMLLGGIDVDTDVASVDGDISTDGETSGFRLTLSTLSYFMIGFGSAGLIFQSFGAAQSLTAGLVTGMITFFLLRKCFVTLCRFCHSGEVPLTIPHVGDLCITLTNLEPHEKGLVRIFEGVSNPDDIVEGETRQYTYFALSDVRIPVNSMCYVSEIIGNTVMIKRNSDVIDKEEQPVIVDAEAVKLDKSAES